MSLIGVSAQQFYQSGLQSLAIRSTPALAITISFALIAWGLRAVNKSGALAGATVTFVVFVAMGLEGFVVVFLVFVLTYISTRFGHSQKERLGIVQSDGRSAGQVLANVAAAAISCGPVLFYPHSRTVLFAGACAALAEAAADTVSSEMGQAFRFPTYMITTFSRVPVGQNGGISVVGTANGIVAALLIAMASTFAGLIPVSCFFIVAVAGMGGMLFDSVLGATFEAPGRLGNNSVNFLSTVFAACCGILFTYLLL
jgi:uncharacterized protein (TIGR00297 family)